MKKYHIITQVESDSDEINENELYENISDVINDFKDAYLCFYHLYEALFSYEGEECEYVGLHTFDSKIQLRVYIEGLETVAVTGYETNWLTWYGDINELQREILSRKVLTEKTLEVFKKQ